jgi:prepilin-type N-terminal cleavage/methylation domain-containing protein
VLMADNLFKNVFIATLKICLLTNVSKEFIMIRTNKGFTLIELMVVIVIIGVLAALAIPKFTDAATKAKISEIPTVLGSWDHAVLARIAEAGATPTAMTDLVFEADTTSKWFIYTPTFADPTLYTATVATGKTVGPYTSSTTGASTSITGQSAVTHNRGGIADKYLPNF